MAAGFNHTPKPFLSLHHAPISPFDEMSGNWQIGTFVKILLPLDSRLCSKK